MITKETILSQLQISEGRCVIADFMLVVKEGGVEISRSKGPHTISFMPDADLALILVANNADITTREGMKWPAIQQADWQRVTGHCAVEHTSEVKAAYAAMKAKQAGILNSKGKE